MAMTKSQIRAKINQLTREKNNKNAVLNQYQNSLNKAKELINKLTETSKYLSNTSTSLKRNFTVNGKSADSGKTESIKNEIDKAIRKLNSEVSPSINSNINSLKSQIKNLDTRIYNLRRQYNQAEI